ncbi:MAG: ferric reductase-like transmembrane domain-containing protein [Devosia sp.]|nr:ferric reductase-like transmembrane domain-containing protein [Devosia sp.]
MRNIVLAFWGLVLVLSVLWLIAEPTALLSTDVMGLRSGFIQYTGVIGIGAMSAAMVLATRPRWLEPHVNGLDKMYRLHKWLGITGLVFSVAHWMWTQAPQWLTGLGLLSMPAGRGPPSTEAAATENTAAATTNSLEQLFSGLRRPAESIGEWAFYVSVILIALALIKWFPYHLFVKTHKFTAVAYLLLAFHTMVLLNTGDWLTPLGLVMALLLASGTVSAALTLSGRVGIGSRVQGTVSSLFYAPALRVLETKVHLDQGWSGHDTGQFAFVTSSRNEGAHPYTIASSWKNDGEITFVTKALGDYTSKMHAQLKVGDPVKVEGPYGSFTFRDDKPRQIWVGGGIGITPFIARMQHLAAEPNPEQQVDFFHTTLDFDEEAIRRLTEDARTANISLHVTVDDRDGRLTADKIRELVPEWRSASIWFCGPPGFADALRRNFASHGFSRTLFHQELFSMR